MRLPKRRDNHGIDSDAARSHVPRSARASLPSTSRSNGRCPDSPYMSNFLRSGVGGPIFIRTGCNKTWRKAVQIGTLGISLLCALCVLCDLCVNSFFFFRPSTFDSQLSSPSDLSPFFSHSYALFCTTGVMQLFWNQLVAHSFRHHGVYTPSSPVGHFCYSGRPNMIASPPLRPQNATRKRKPTL